MMNISSSILFEFQFDMITPSKTQSKEGTLFRISLQYLPPAPSCKNPQVKSPAWEPAMMPTKVDLNTPLPVHEKSNQEKPLE